MTRSLEGVDLIYLREKLLIINIRSLLAKKMNNLIAWKSCQMLLLSVLAVIYMVSIYASSGAAHAASTIVTVTMTDKPPTYCQGKLTIKACTTVEWKNTAATLHDVTTDSSAVRECEGCISTARRQAVRLWLHATGWDLELHVFRAWPLRLRLHST